jgi:hypothetical protein
VVVAVAREASSAQLKSLQSGTAALSGISASVIFPLSPPVDPTKAFLVFGVSENTDNPMDGQVSGQINPAGDSITFQTVPGSAPSIDITYYVAEFSSGVSVQRGNIDISTDTGLNNVALTAVSLANSFPLISYRAAGVNFDCNDFVRAKITTPTNLELTNVPGCGIAPSVVEWQVVQYQDATVQTGDVPFAAADLSQTVPLASPGVDPAKSWLIYSYESQSTADIGQCLVRGLVTGSGATLTFDRNNSGVALNLTWYLVTFADATVVQSGSQPFLIGETQTTATLPTPAPPATSIAVGGGEYERGGRSPYSADDNPGVGWFGFDLASSTNLQITRGAGGLATADVGWFVLSFEPPTAVQLMSFSASGSEGAVDLAWQTGSELDNLGFHLHRSLSPEGPWTRITSSLIPGLGHSPLGASYSWRDSGLVDGTRYFYRLEDVDTSSVSTFHGPVSAVPSATAPPPSGGGGGGSGPDGPRAGPGSDPSPGASPGSPSSCPAWVLAASGSSASPSSATCQAFGEPSATSLRVLSHSRSGAVVELATGGFVALREADGSVRVFIPGFDSPTDPSSPALPLRRALIDALVGRGVRLGAVDASSLRSYAGLRPSAVGAARVAFSPDGTVRPSRRRASLGPAALGYVPRDVVRLAGLAFQGEDKQAVLEISPVRFDAARGRLVLARRVKARLFFAGTEPTETGAGSLGRRSPPMKRPVDVLAQLHTAAPGLYAVSFEALFPGRQRGIGASFLRLQRQGTAVPFHVEPASPVFGPGSVLYFYTDAVASSADFSSEIAFELVRSTEGQTMDVVVAAPATATASSASLATASLETNRIYQPGLLDAPDPWLWETVWGGLSTTESFSLSGVDSLSSHRVRLVVSFQGGSDVAGVVDHHLRVFVNGAAVGDTRFDGERAQVFEATLPVSLLREGSNDLTVENVGDAGVYSLVFLDKFSLVYPQTSSLRGGRLVGRWMQTGTAELSGVSSRPVGLDITPVGTVKRSLGFAAAGATSQSASNTSSGKWLTGLRATASTVRFFVQAGHLYLVASTDGLLAPRISIPAPSSLRASESQADLLVIAPEAFLPSAQPLLEKRRDEGLSARGVSLEEIASAFGHGQPSPQAIHDFLVFAFHSWARPSPRYVLLLGDSSFDPRRFLTTSSPAPLPALWTRTSYLWTVSDPLLAAVNGDDPLPDLAIGRLPAASPEEAEMMVAKVLDWEDSGQDLEGKAVLVADNPDSGGDFEADALDIARTCLAGRDVRQIFLSQLGSETRAAILDSFDSGASLMSYVGHGGSAVWASENILNSWDADSLLAQPRQPVMITMNCLNGYFVAPNFDALSEAFLKAEGRGAIAAFSPSGLSLDAPAHTYHRALVAELTSGRHRRLGDALLAAQKTYARAGVMPELLSIYHLLGDPTMKIR